VTGTMPSAPAERRGTGLPTRRLNCCSAALLATMALGAAASLPPGAARAQDATWLANPSDGNFNNNVNWNPATVPAGTAFFDTSNTTSLSFSADTTIGGWTFNAGASNYTFTNDQTLTFNGAGVAINGGSASITNNAILQFNNTSTAGSATITNNFSAFLNFTNASSAGSATIINSFDGVAPQGGLSFFDTSTAGSATITNHGTMQFFNTSTAGDAAITNSAFAPFLGFGTLIFNDASTAGSAAISNDSIVEFFGSSTAGSATITNNGQIYIFQSASGGTARFIFNGFGLLDISGLSNGGTTAGSIEGAGTVFLGAKTLTVGGNDLSTAFSGVIKDGGLFGGTGGSLTKTGTGTLTLAGTNAYTGATTVNAGTLTVDGSIAASILTTVNNGGTLGGTGTVGATQINGGGIFAPGALGLPGTIEVAGSLAFQSGAAYVVYLNPSTSTSADVTGSASLAGTVDANFASGAYMSKKTYDILHSAGLNGTTFDALATTNLPNFDASLSYTSTDVLLTLTAALGAGTTLNRNQQNVANALTNFFNSGGTLPPGFAGIFNLTGANLANALSQLDGEDATGAERGAFQLLDEFLGLMLDPFVDGRGNGGVVGGALGFAPDQAPSFAPDVALAYPSVLKAPPQPQTFDRRWTVWGAGFGGSNHANGDPVIGSNNVTTSTYGYAGGMDYHLSPDTVVGFALSGGGINWDLAQGLGTGRSDAIQAGVYGATHAGAGYLAAALALANDWFTTNRTALGDQLTARFQGQSYGARLEGGYRFAAPVDRGRAGVTPYAAVQAQDFHTPTYGETDLTGGGFGLSYAAMTGTDTRSELGGRFDDLTALGTMPLVLRAKLAWAHDWVSNPALNAAFESLPGTGFTVNGARIAKNAALTTAGAQLWFTTNWSLLAKFDGEFASASQTYAGSGTLRYSW